MKQHLVYGVVGALALVPLASTAQAAAPAPSVAQARTGLAIRTTYGKTVSYKGGKLRVAERKKSTDFLVTRTSECGVMRGSKGSTFPCANLGQKRYLKKSVRIGWYYDAKKRRIAAFIALTGK